MRGEHAQLRRPACYSWTILVADGPSLTGLPAAGEAAPDKIEPAATRADFCCLRGQSGRLVDPSWPSRKIVIAEVNKSKALKK